MIPILWVALGGMVGAVLRFGLIGWIDGRFHATAFPVGLLVVNVLGCFLIGLMMGLVEARTLLNPDAQKFLIVGLLGSLTTYSTFSMETFGMMELGAWVAASALVLLHVFLGLSATWAGVAMARGLT